jgi:hypothetical protein
MWPRHRRLTATIGILLKCTLRKCSLNYAWSEINSPKQSSHWNVSQRVVANAAVDHQPG